MTTSDLNPYTQAMLNCLRQFEDQAAEVPEMDKSSGQFLANMIQGRFIQYFITKISSEFRIKDKEIEKQLTIVLMNLLKNKFFSVFREKMEVRPEIIYQIARKITRTESLHSGNSRRMDALFRSISQKYLEYHNVATIMKWISSNHQIQKIVFVARLKEKIQNPALLKTILYIAKNDQEGIVQHVFSRYLKKNRLERLDDLIKTGDWKIEADFVQQRLRKTINWRRYMDDIL